MSTETDSYFNDHEKELLQEYQKDQECQKMYMRTDILADFYLMHIGAWKYLKKGIWKDRIRDYFELPDSPFDEAEFSKGCEQILDWKGFNEKTPFRLSTCAMENLMRNFHFEMIEQKAIAQDSESILDELLYEHLLVKSRISIYNLVYSEWVQNLVL
jgi:hypothetical protein